MSPLSDGYRVPAKMLETAFRSSIFDVTDSDLVLTRCWRFIGLCGFQLPVFHGISVAL